MIAQSDRSPVTWAWTPEHDGRFVRSAGMTRLVLEGLPDMPLFDLRISLRRGFLRATGDLCSAGLGGRTRLKRTAAQRSASGRASSRAGANSND